MANPFFLSQNYIKADDTITVSSGNATKARLYDQNKTLQWQSVGETSESGYNTSIEIVFYEGLIATNRIFDTLVLQNINLKQFKLQWWNGSSYVDISEFSFTANALTTMRVKLTSAVTTSKIKLLMQSTITANQEKKIGQFWCLKETFELTEGRHNHIRADYKDGGNYRLASGTLETFTLFKKYAANIDFELLTLASIVLFKALYDTDENFTFYLNYSDDLDAIYNVVWVNTFNYDEDTLRGYFKLSMTIEEQ
ncbi:MAG: hypothetical protein M0Q46_06190 [Endomicrobiales bacterium]|nr:hypothetical protein [Endomicrobiales bacterium]